MHHSIRFYSNNRKGVLRFYMLFAHLSRVPLLGRVVRWASNLYGTTAHQVYLLTPGEASRLLEMAAGVARTACTCRSLYHKCDNPRDNEILLGPTRHIFIEALPKESREISKAEAAAILEESHRRGLILTAAKCRNDFYAICSCCSCCCVPLRLNKKYGIGQAMVRHKNIIEEFRDYQAALAAEHG